MCAICRQFLRRPSNKPLEETDLNAGKLVLAVLNIRFKSSKSPFIRIILSLRTEDYAGTSGVLAQPKEEKQSLSLSW